MHLPWKTIEDESEKKDLENELAEEVIEGHILYARDVKALARRIDMDDVLFEISEGSKIAIVHLTYSQETNPRFPLTEIYETMDECKERRLQVDSMDWE